MFLKIFFSKDRELVLIFLVLFLLFVMTGCGNLNSGSPIAGFGKDVQLSTEETAWLSQGEQSKLTSKISRESVMIKGKTRRELLYKTVNYIWHHFKYDNWYLDKAFSATAGEIFNGGILGSCSDVALAEVTLLRALGIPARMILSINTDWTSAYKKNEFLIPRGHVFIEVYLENGWHLFDPAFRLLYHGYDPEIKSLPRQEYFVVRGIDYWDVGIINMTDLIKRYRSLASAFDPLQYVSPHYSKTEIKFKKRWP